MLREIDFSVVLNFWFSQAVKPKWFIKDFEFDKLIAQKFENIYSMAKTEKLDQWMKTPEGCLAIIITLDQFPRNMFRGLPQSFETDSRALSLTKYALDNKMDKNLNFEQKQFLYMPLMHSETLNDQELSLTLFLSNSYAKRHWEIIKTFKRFPHRNKILGRESIKEELEFLQTPNSSF
jgi:uncharacterized protein (DUF924 family)